MVRAVGWCCRSSNGQEKQEKHDRALVHCYTSYSLHNTHVHVHVQEMENLRPGRVLLGAHVMCDQAWVILPWKVKRTVCIALLSLSSFFSPTSPPPPLPLSLLSLSVCFTVFDEDGDGLLSQPELTRAVTALQSILRENSEESSDDLEDVVCVCL